MELNNLLKQTGRALELLGFVVPLAPAETALEAIDPLRAEELAIPFALAETAADSMSEELERLEEFIEAAEAAEPEAGPADLVEETANVVGAAELVTPLEESGVAAAD